MRLPSARPLELGVLESSCLGLQLKVGGKFHLKLNIGGKPIAYKYREGKMQRTLKRELKEYLKLLKGKQRKPVLVESYFSLRLRGGRCVLAPVRLGWAGRNRAVGVDHCMSAMGLTEADEMVFFTPS